MYQDADPTLSSTSSVTLNSLPLIPRLQAPCSQIRGQDQHQPHSNPPFSTDTALWTRKLLWNYEVSLYLIDYILFFWVAKKIHFLSPILPNPISLSCSLELWWFVFHFCGGQVNYISQCEKMFFEEMMSLDGVKKESSFVSDWLPGEQEDYIF